MSPPAEPPQEPPPPASGMRPAGLLREPLVHFAALGGLLFAAFYLLGDGPAPQSAQAPRITVDAARQTMLAEQFSSVWQRPPTAEEQARLVDDWIEAQVLVREARALGLEQGDPVVEQRLRQKMDFLLSGLGAAEPLEAELRAFYDADPARYGSEAMLAFRQVPLGETAPSEAEITRIGAALADGADPAGLAPPSLLPAAVPLSPASLVDRQFGTGTAERIAALPAGRWAGPVQTGYGWHLVRLDALEPAAIPPFEDVAERVRADWEEEATKARLAERIAALRARYQIEIAPAGPPDASATAAGAAAAPSPEPAPEASPGTPPETGPQSGPRTGQ